MKSSLVTLLLAAATVPAATTLAAATDYFPSTTTTTTMRPFGDNSTWHHNPSPSSHEDDAQNDRVGGVSSKGRPAPVEAIPSKTNVRGGHHDSAPDMGATAHPANAQTAPASATVDGTHVCHAETQTCVSIAEAGVIGDTSYAMSFAECTTTCGSDIHSPAPPAHPCAHAHADAEAGPGGVQAKADAGIDCGPNSGPHDQPSGGDYDPCSIHVNCMVDDANYPLWNGYEWTCSDDPQGVNSNDGFDTCKIHAGCSLPDVWPQYDGDQHTWYCCDEMQESCLPSLKPTPSVVRRYNDALLQL